MKKKVRVAGMNMLTWWQQYAPIVWLLLAIAFAVSEGLTVQLVSIWFAVGAAAALFDVSWVVQLWTFVIVSAVLLIGTRPIAKNLLHVKKESTNADRFIGQVGVVTDPIDNDLSAGRARVGGLDWSVRSSDGADIPAGEKIRVLAIDGVKLIVEPCGKQTEQ